MASLAKTTLRGAACLLAVQVVGRSARPPATPGSCRTHGGSEHALLQRRAGLTPAGASVPGPLETRECHTLLEGEGCYADVLWAVVHGIYDKPEWYPGLSPASRWEDFQEVLHRTRPAECPKPCASPELPRGSPPCEARAVHLDVFSAKLVHNNLGGLGPDSGAPNMRYAHVGTVGDRPFDLVVTAAEGYKSHRQSRNGLAGRFGIVNLKAGTSAKVTFSFEDPVSGEPVVLEEFHFSILDLDESGHVRERLSVKGFERYVLAEGSEVAVHEAADGQTSFESTERGSGCDNPRDPLELGEVTCKGRTVDQRKRAVTFLFTNRSNFSATLELVKRRHRGSGRNFLFAGSSSLSYACEEAPRLGLCATFGDPHFVTFDGAHTVLMADRAIWLVRSAEVWIQAMSRNAAGWLVGLAVGGPFLGGRVLVLRRSGGESLHASFDDAAILEEAEADFQAPGPVRAHRREAWNATLHRADVLAVRTQIQFAVGPWPERFLGRPKGGLYLFRLPRGVEITATGVDTMSVVITMPRQAEGQSGYCGNFDGNPADDFEKVAPSFNRPSGDHLGPVEAADDLFVRASALAFGEEPAHPQGDADAPQTPLDPERALRECAPDLRQEAERRCARVADGRRREDCVVDVCGTGLVAAADRVLAAEVLEEKVNARGIPVPVGSGRCLDVAGRHYAAFRTSTTGREACQDELRGLSLEPGVVGAQLRPGSECQILVHEGVDPRGAKIKGRWGNREDAQGGAASGEGIVSQASGESGWFCWRLS